MLYGRRGGCLDSARRASDEFGRVKDAFDWMCSRGLHEEILNNL